ncbi:MAG TPA: MFS transporter [Syntrophobacteraceae bacterium]|nr:MFS transporter [Syntrophobacteraceae bacterium]
MGRSAKDPVPTYEALLVLCCVVTSMCYLGSHMRIPVVPLFARTLGADTFQVGAVNASFLFTAALLSLPLGLLSDRLGRKRLITAGLLIISLSSFLLCFSTTVLEMIGIYLLFGTGLAAFAPTMMSFVADFSPPTHLGRSYGWYTLALYGGMSTGPALGGALAGWVGFQWTFAVSGAVTLAVLFLVAGLLPRAGQVLVNRPSKRPTGEVAKELVKNAPLLACWVATLGGCLGLGMFVTFVPLYAQDQGVRVEQIGFIFGLQALCNALSRIPFGRLSDRAAKRSRLATAGLLGLSVSIAGLGPARGMGAFLLFAAGLGISMGIAFTAIGALISEVVAPDARGLAMGGYNSAIYIGMMVSSLVMGAVIREIGFKNAFLIVAVLNLGATGLFHRVFSHSPA